jgi:hypothetical protein
MGGDALSAIESGTPIGAVHVKRISTTGSLAYRYARTTGMRAPGAVTVLSVHAHIVAAAMATASAHR